MLLYHHNRADVSGSAMVYYQVLSIFGLVQELLHHSLELTSGAEPEKEDIITYIRDHIYQPGKCRIKVIAGYFHISAHYFSAYFKRNFGSSYRDYLNSYRVQLIESRLKIRKMSLKQIASN